MNAGRELDALVAEKLMGLRPRQVRIAGTTNEATIYTDSPYYGSVVERRDLHHVKPKPYSTEIAAAWQIVERSAAVSTNRFRFHFHLDLVDGDWRAFLRVGSTESEEATEGDATAETAPLAICLAALKAVGAEVAA